MNYVNIANAKENFFQLVSEVNNGFNPIMIVNSKGKNAVLISEEEWNNIKETLFLESIPGFVENINVIRKKENWNNAKIFNYDEKY